jgi:hypothetical protein
MTLNEIANIHLVRQHVVNSPFDNVRDFVQSMGAMQAQDYQMAKWAVGLRVQGASDESVESAIDSGDLIRTHLMRPTWHLVSREDAAWLIELTAQGIKASQKSRNRELELSDNVFARTNKILGDAVRNGNHMTREELMTIIRNEGIETVNNRGSHILFTAELDKIVCSGRIKNGRQTYALFSERVPSGIISRDEALRKIAEKYFFTRGPATIKDFSWWSGLPVTDARKALEMIRSKLVSETIENKVYWFPPDAVIPFHGEKKIHLLPAFDEFIISYSDRSAVMSLVYRKRTVSINGIFNPVIIVDGQVAGLWKRSKKNKTILIETELFSGKRQSRSIIKSIEEKAEEYGRFLKKEVAIIHH